jgi:hypothetical protein
MKRLLIIAADYLFNAALSAMLALVVALLVCFLRGLGALPLSTAATYMSIGAICGSCSKLSIEGAFLLFGERKALAYILNFLVIALVLPLATFGLFGGFGDTPVWAVWLIFAFVEVGSVPIVYAYLDEASGIERALRKRNESHRD